MTRRRIPVSEDQDRRIKEQQRKEQERREERRNKLFPPEIDLRPICRDSDKFYVTVFLVHPYEGKKEWLRLGRADFTRGESRTNDKWRLNARLGPENRKRGAPTDFEHDSAYACDLSFVGVNLDMVLGHTTMLTGYIDPSQGTGRVGDEDVHVDFHVPEPGYDPRKHPDAHTCEDKICTSVPLKDGGGPHTIVPEGFYKSPFNRKLYETVRGWRVEIWIGMVEEE